MGNTSGISKREIGNLLEDIKTDLLNHMGKQIDTRILTGNKRKLKRPWQYIVQLVIRGMD